MQQVITEKQARQITGGRKPLVPLEYEEAVKAVSACLSIDEAKRWGDKADAYAAWAQIHRSDELLRKAKQLKLYAYRRMGELAAQLRPARYKKGGAGQTPGPVSALLEIGLTKEAANSARRLARASKEEFDAVVSLPRPPAITTVHNHLRGNGAQAGTLGWSKFSIPAHTFRSYCRLKSNPAMLCKEFSADERVKAKVILIEIAEWIDECLRVLPK